ncbi:MAG: DUF3662 domain-containing protein [Marmoricola sp.]
MSKLNDFERRLEGLISGLFARTFKSSVQPVEIASQLNRELDTNAQILSRDRRIVPNSFSVELSPSDYASLDALGSGLKRELTEMMREHAAGSKLCVQRPDQHRFGRGRRRTHRCLSGAQRHQERRKECCG